MQIMRGIVPGFFQVSVDHVLLQKLICHKLKVAGRFSTGDVLASELLLDIFLDELWQLNCQLHVLQVHSVHLFQVMPTVIVGLEDFATLHAT